MQNVHFSPPQLAKLFQVNPSTIKRWIDKGYMKADVSPGGHRRVSQEQLSTFIHQYPKHAKNSYVISRLKNTQTQNSWKTYFDLLYKNNPASGKHIEQLFIQSTPLVEILRDHFIPTLQHIGKQWSIGKLDVYEEHRMSFTIRRHLAHLQELLPQPSTNAPNAILACAPGDHHEIPLMMVSLLFQERGWSPNVLGINIPTKEIIKAADAADARVICISKTYSAASKNILSKSLVSYAKKSRNQLILGGNGWSESIRKKVWRSKKMHYVKNMEELQMRLQKYDTV